MLKIIYEDHDILVAEKPAGLESQASRGFEPDMVSEIKNHLKRAELSRLSTKPSTKSSTRPVEPMSELSTDWTSLSGESWFTLRIRRRQPLLASRFRMAG
ncbi:MAG: hypothetical protein ACLS70_07900 [[Clostridium] symbiosum]